MKRQKITIWFDDGYESIFKVAYPIMEKYGLTGIVGVITGKVGKTYGTKKYGMRKLMSIKQLKILINNGWEIGSHTVSHPVMKLLSKKQFLTEILVSKRWIIKNLDIIPNKFIPSGRSITDEQIEIAKKYYSYVRPFAGSRMEHLIFHDVTKEELIRRFKEAKLIGDKTT